MMVQSTLKRFNLIKPSSELYDGERIVAGTTMNVFIKIIGEKHNIQDISKEWVHWHFSLYETVQLSFFPKTCQYAWFNQMPSSF